MGREGGMMRVMIVAVVLLSLVPLSLTAQRGRAEVEEGNRLYFDQRFEEAHQRYLDALRRAPGSGLIRFNDGNALYKGNDYEQAMEAYRAAAQSGDRALQARAWYNLGNALFRLQQPEGAAEAYREALRLDPGDQDAKHNLERVLQVEEQEQQQQSDRENDQSQDRDQQQQQQRESERRQQDQSQNEQQRRQERDQQQSPEQQPREEPEEQRGQQPEMTPEEAQQLLKAIQEDPSKIRRQHKTTAGERRPRRKW